jgi:hypothetical protein
VSWIAPGEVSEKYANCSKTISEQPTEAIDMPTDLHTGLKFAFA